MTGVWQDDALCAQVGGDFWFPEKGETATSRQAKEICNACPVRTQCLEYAVTGHITWGIFGGVSARERALLTQERNRRTA